MSTVASAAPTAPAASSSTPSSAAPSYATPRKALIVTFPGTESDARSPDKFLNGYGNQNSSAHEDGEFDYLPTADKIKEFLHIQKHANLSDADDTFDSKMSALREEKHLGMPSLKAFQNLVEKDTSAKLSEPDKTEVLSAVGKRTRSLHGKCRPPTEKEKKKAETMRKSAKRPEEVETGFGAPSRWAEGSDFKNEDYIFVHLNLHSCADGGDDVFLPYIRVPANDDEEEKTIFFTEDGEAIPEDGETTGKK